MSRRNSPNDPPDLHDLGRLAGLIFYKRQDQRAVAMRHRRKRHYERRPICSTMAHLPRLDRAKAGEQVFALPPDSQLQQEEGT